MSFNNCKLVTIASALCVLCFFAGTKWNLSVPKKQATGNDQAVNKMIATQINVGLGVPAKQAVVKDQAAGRTTTTTAKSTTEAKTKTTTTTPTTQPLIVAADYRKSKGLSGGVFLGTGQLSQKILDLKLHDAQVEFYRWATYNEYECKNITRCGPPGSLRGGGGGYDICTDEPFVPKVGDCLVYSFGIKNDFGFDDAINAKYKCEVHSFDPSMHREDHVHKEPNMFFHNLGLSGFNGKSKQGWQMKDLASIIEMLGHKNRIIDVVKADIEGSEWPLLVSIIKTGVHKQIRQFLFEPHTPTRKKPMNLVDYAEIYNSYEQLHNVGFKQFLYYARNLCCGPFSILTPKDIAKLNRNLCCYEQFYVNTRFL